MQNFNYEDVPMDIRCCIVETTDAEYLNTMYREVPLFRTPIRMLYPEGFAYGLQFNNVVGKPIVYSKGLTLQDFIIKEVDEKNKYISHCSLLVINVLDTHPNPRQIEIDAQFLDIKCVKFVNFTNTRTINRFLVKSDQCIFINCSTIPVDFDINDRIVINGEEIPTHPQYITFLNQHIDVSFDIRTINEWIKHSAIIFKRCTFAAGVQFNFENGSLHFDSCPMNIAEFILLMGESKLNELIIYKCRNIYSSTGITSRLYEFVKVYISKNFYYLLKDDRWVQCDLRKKMKPKQSNST